MGYLHNNASVFLHMYELCEYSVRNKNPKYLQVVQAQSVCVYVCACVFVTNMVYGVFT